jgi:hypothetical protein
MSNYGGGGGCSGASIYSEGWARGAAERRLDVSLLAAAMVGVRERLEEEGGGNRMNRYVCNQWHDGLISCSCSTEAARMSISRCMQNEVSEGIVSVRSRIGIKPFGAIHCLISTEAIENRSQTWP